MPTVSMNVNGRPRSADVDARTLLVQFLRENLRLTGTHVGCDTSQCGACVVHIDGEAVKACTTLAVSCEGSNVLTIEGLANGNELHPMQEAFREHHGLQCGFCTPGMIMTAVDLVRRKGNSLDEKTIREELKGNLCRCTGYHNIVKAIAAGARNMSSMPQQSCGISSALRLLGRIDMNATGIGAAVPRKEDHRFITGKGRYVDDIDRPGQAHAFFLRSPHAHANIRSLDASAAESRPGSSRCLPATISRPTKSAG